MLMNYASENFLQNIVKVIAEVSGEEKVGTGYLYLTSQNSKYDYIFTAKHTLMCSDDDDVIYHDQLSKISFHNSSDHLNLDDQPFAVITKSKIEDYLIEFEDDLVLIKIYKSIKRPKNFIQFTTSGTENCTSFAVTSANESTFFPLEIKLLTNKQNRYSISGWKDFENLHGSSGAAIITKDKPVIQGFIKLHPTKEYSAAYIDSVKLCPIEINETLEKHKLEKVLFDGDSKVQRIVDDKLVVDLNECIINEVEINLLKAVKRLEVDQYDDWFHDPLSYVDLKSTDFLFDYFKEFFKGTVYKPSSAEIFYLPKSSLTLRKAMILTYSDKLLYSAFVEILGPKIEKTLISSVFSSRYNAHNVGGLIISGVEQWKKMTYHLEECILQYNYIIEIDILNFFDNISIDLLTEKLMVISESKNERNAAQLIGEFLNEFSHKSGSGIPQNNDASSLLATFYLNEIDTYMIHQTPKYIRFMDDIKIFCTDEFEARKYLSLIEMKLKELKLSLNGQKTQIINLKPQNINLKKEVTEKYPPFFNLERSKLSRLFYSSNFLHKNESFHLAIKFVKKFIELDSNGDDPDERSLQQALSILKKGKLRGIKLNDYSTEIEEILVSIPKLLKSKPWITPQLTYLIAILDIEMIPEETWDGIIEMVTNKKYNTYNWQCYHLWLLLAHHQISNDNLSCFASEILDSNDEMNKPVVAAMMIYMSSVDVNYRSIILDKYNKNFTSGHFQERLALISLRNFNTEDVCRKKSSSRAIHGALSKYKNKPLVYVNGEIEDENFDLIPIYSL